MTDTQINFRKSLDGIVEARGRESVRQVGSSMQHQLIGAFTKRP